ncbi:MAG: mnmE, partial [Clostridia bacterium]|nr:mnmE [Clostridia bacterium]
MNNYNQDTITALSTPPFMSAIGVIRISGEKTFDIVEKIFSKSIKNVESHTAHHGFIQDKDGNILDDVVITVFKKPNSYTGEDIVEISCHGSLYIIKTIQNLIIALGGRQALNGEFTKRAFLNGKMDLSQVEAVIDLIESQSEKEVNNAINHLKGHLSKKINEIRNELLDISGQIMAYIDFPDDEIADVSHEYLSSSIKKALDNIKILKISFNKGQIIKNGIKTIIIGKPNVGKSLLMNRLLGYDRSIVTDIEG